MSTEKKKIFVTVDGGVAYAVEGTVPEGYVVEIIDYDNLRETDNPGDEWDELSLEAQEYIRKDDPEFADKCEADGDSNDMHRYGVSRHLRHRSS
jgi:hypothetical protein